MTRTESRRGRLNLAQDIVPQALTYLGVFFIKPPTKSSSLAKRLTDFSRGTALGAESKDLKGRLFYSCRWHPFNHRSPHLADRPRFKDSAQTWGWKMITVHEKMN